MRKFLLLAVLVLASAISASAQYPVTDSFPTAGALSANWTNNLGAGSTGAISITTNGHVGVSAFKVGAARWTANAFNNDQYSQYTFTKNNASDFIAVCVRLSSGGNGYCALFNASGVCQIDLLTNGATVFGANCSSLTVNVNDVIRLRAVGTTMTISRNGTDQGSLVDATYASGNAGMHINQASTGGSGDIEMGSFSADCIPTCQPSRVQRRR